MRLIPALFVLLSACAAQTRELETLRAVGPEGAGNPEASRAWQAVVAGGTTSLLPALGALDGASPRAANWLRSAVEAVAEQAGPADIAPLEAFVLDRTHDGPSRRLAYEILVRLDPRAPDRLLPGMLDDPGRELRRDAVARALPGAAQDAARLRKLLLDARDRDQVDAIVKQLKELKVEVDVPALYGVVTRWSLHKSFDNAGGKGFDIAYAPEKGERAAGVTTSTDPLGKVDLNAVLGKEKAVVAYAFAAIDLADARPAEIRVGTNNAVKLFLNGVLLYARDEYHHGMKMDQYVGRAALKKGRNEILLKICQNDQKEDWAQSWSFQARICDALGGAVPFRLLD